MSVTLPIDEIDFKADSTAQFLNVYNLQFMPLNWARDDVEYLRTETDPHYPDLSTLWVRVNAYPTLSDDSEIVQRNGRHYDMSLTVNTTDLELPPPPESDPVDPVDPGPEDEDPELNEDYILVE